MATTVAASDIQLLQRRTLALLAAGQVLGGLGVGAAFSVGALAANKLAGETWSGMASTMTTLGAALLAVPLASLANQRGRRLSLGTAAVIATAGIALCVVAMVLAAPLLLFVGFAGAGASTAAALQSRFAAIDLAGPATRGRDLSLVVWSTTIGAVIGPNLAETGESLGRLLGLPEFSGVFVFAVVAQSLAALVYLLFLRPDPLLTSRRLGLGELAAPPTSSQPGGPTTAQLRGNIRVTRLAILATALSHATMVALMAMTPVHLMHGGATLSIVGLTISLHVLGMFGLSPVFGLLSDRIGRIPTLLAGQIMLALAATVTAIGSDQHQIVMVGLCLLGLGWSASTVAGSALIGDAAPAESRIKIQGRSDLLMSLAGACGGAASGLLLALLGYQGLAWMLFVPVAVVIAAVLVVRPGRFGYR